MSPARTPRIRVVVPPGAEMASWSVLVDRVAGLAGLGAEALALDREHGPLDALAAAVGTDDLLLVLPVAAPPSPSGTPRTVLVPCDRSRAERDVLRGWIERAERDGLEVRQLHVLTHGTRPRMWEGPGHHAEAWREAVRGRHRVGTASWSVENGDPARTILAESSGSDLLVLCWRGRVGPEHAVVLREVLVGTTRPVLVVRAPPAGEGRRGTPSVPDRRRGRGGAGVGPFGPRRRWGTSRQ